MWVPVNWVMGIKYCFYDDTTNGFYTMTWIVDTDLFVDVIALCSFIQYKVTPVRNKEKNTTVNV